MLTRVVEPAESSVLRLGYGVWRAYIGSIHRSRQLIAVGGTAGLVGVNAALFGAGAWSIGFMGLAAITLFALQLIFTMLEVRSHARRPDRRLWWRTEPTMTTMAKRDKTGDCYVHGIAAHPAW